MTRSPLPRCPSLCGDRNEQQGQRTRRKAVHSVMMSSVVLDALAAEERVADGDHPEKGGVTTPMMPR